MTALRDCRCQPTAGAPSHHRDAIRVDAEFLGVCAHPLQGRHAVVECGRKRMLGREAVIR